MRKHVHVLTEVQDRLRSAGLTVCPTQCFVGYESIDILGHVLGEGFLQPQPSKVEAIGLAKRPILVRKKYVPS